MRKVGELSALHEMYFPRGFRVVGISSESVSVLRDRVVEARNGRFWMGSDTQGTTTRHYLNDWGSVAIPRYYLVDVDGKVVGEGIPSEERLKELLRGVFDPALDRELHPRLLAARQAYEAGAYATANALAAKLRGDADQQVADDAALLCDKVAELVAFTRRVTEHELEFLTTREAFVQLTFMRHQFSGMETCKWIEERLAALAEQSQIRSDEKAWKKLDKVLAREFGIWSAAPKRRAYEIKRGISEYGRLRKSDPSFQRRFVAERIAALEGLLAEQQ